MEPSSLQMQTTTPRSDRYQFPTKYYLLNHHPGALATCLAFAGAARMGYKKNSRGMQYFFRARVAAQAFTVLALWAGIYVYSDDRKAGNWKIRERAEAAAKAKHVSTQYYGFKN
jgi:Hypoxia induced protein conserved region